MQAASLPPQEQERLAALRRYEVLDTTPEETFDELTEFASRLCDTPIALISLVDADRQWFKARVGLGAPETHRDLAFCAHAILRRELFEVRDTFDDARFADNPLVVGDPKIRFYAGTPLVTPEGQAIGTLCVIDRVPRALTDLQRAGLHVLGRQVIAQLELRTVLRRQADLVSHQEQLIRQLSLTPIISVAPGILLVPLVGALDPARATEIMDAVLGAVATRRARAVIVDLTGVEDLDSATAEHLLRLCNAASLLGAAAVLAGITPGVARSVIALGTDLSRTRTVSDVAEALRQLLAG